MEHKSQSPKAINKWQNQDLDSIHLFHRFSINVGVFAHRGHWTMSGDPSSCHNWGSTIGM